MLQIKEIVNSIFTSKTYVLYRDGENKAWLVDIGDIEPLLAFCIEKELSIEGVFITHAHFDHIYGIEALVENFPNCKVYVTAYAKDALASDKLNMSRYHETPFVYDGNNVVVVHEGEEIKLFDDEPSIHFYETPGHNPGCLTMILGDMIFTGDAYIPGIKTNCQLPFANKELAKQSLKRILEMAKDKKVFSGHQV